MDKERKPDLAGDDYQDLEEKVKRMLDPSLPDEGTPSTKDIPDKTQEISKEKTDSPPPASGEKVIRPLHKNIEPAATPSAPPLPEPVDLPMDKKPLKIKVLSGDGTTASSAISGQQEAVDEKPQKADKKKPAAKKKAKKTASKKETQPPKSNPEVNQQPAEESTESPQKKNEPEKDDEKERGDDNASTEEVTDTAVADTDEKIDEEQDSQQVNTEEDQSEIDPFNLEESTEDELEESGATDVAKAPPPEPDEQDSAPEKETVTSKTENTPATKTEKLIESTQTNEAVEDIIAAEGDAILEAEDAKRAELEDVPTGKKKASRPKKRRLKRLFIKLLILGLFIAMVVAVALPQSRYFMLNAAGVRAGASIAVFDQSTLQPLRGVEVVLGGVTEITDEEGAALFEDLRLGETELVVKRRAFADERKTIVLGWGSNPLDNISLQPTGSQFTFVISDFLSGEPLEKAEAVSDGISAFSDEAGLIKLTLDVPSDMREIEVAITANSYRPETLTIETDSSGEHIVQMAAERKHAFISKRSGNYDLYSVYADGNHEEVVLAGSGFERDDIALLQHPSSGYVALVSTREQARNREGTLLSTLFVIGIGDKEVNRIVQSERVQLIGWARDYLLYTQITEGSNADSSRRHRLMSYSLQSRVSKELAASNYFNTVQIVQDTVYYAPSSLHQEDPVKLYRVEPDGSNQQVMVEREVWSLLRVDFRTLLIATTDDWYEYNLQNKTIQKREGDPVNPVNRTYVYSPDNSQKNLWIDRRDGRGVLILRSEKEEEDILHTQSGLSYPLSWLNSDTLVYRVRSSQETADYVMSLRGGEPRKLRDVTHTDNIENWYFH